MVDSNQPDDSDPAHGPLPVSQGAGQQLRLPLAPGHELGLEDLAQGPHNLKALALIEGWPVAWPLPWAALWGPAACGKSALAQIWARHSGAKIWDLEALIAGSPSQRLGHCVLDLGASPGLPQAGEEPLFHLMNNLRAAGFSLLLVARQAPARWSVQLPDLASRLRAVLAVEIGEGDQAFLEQLLVALAAQYELEMRADARAYLIQRLPRQAAACLRLIQILAQQASVVTVPQARLALRALETGDG